MGGTSKEMCMVNGGMREERSPSIGQLFWKYVQKRESRKMRKKR